MKIPFKKLFILSIVLNLVLTIFIFPKNRARVQVLAMKIFGVGTRETAPDYKDTVLVSEYYPNSQFESKDERITKLPKFPVVETHGHIGGMFKTEPTKVNSDLTEFKIQKFINLSFTFGEEFVKLKKEYNDPRIIHFSTFNWKRLGEEDAGKKILADLKQDIQNGTKGIKLWKNFGLNFKKRNGERLKMDDPILDEVFSECEKNGLIISIHTADPPAFFTPIDEKNERYEELLRHPEWSFHGEGFPSFKEVLMERERLFQKHPKLKFIALHFGELSHDLKEAGRLLRENPNVYFDIAARIDELGRHPNETREFFIQWQDRIVFGVDGAPDKNKLEVYSRFLETKDEYFDYYSKGKPRKGMWKIYGLGLPDSILEKIYFKNAESIYNFKS
ncbi:MAG: amidohydrolase family protein [Leptospiraceae bacterium]|nr:amidohydrolase family protein [Leptospiraceae bacterium]